jgi:hypothetical protein
MDKTVRNFKYTILGGRFSGFVAAIAVIVMRVLMFLNGDIPQNEFSDSSFVWKFLAPFFSDPRVSFGASTLSIFIIAAIISHLNRRFTLIRGRTVLPFAVPLFLFSLHPYFLAMTPDFVAVFFLLWALFPLLNSYHRSNPRVFSFQSAVLIGIAGVFQIYALLLLPLWWWGERMVRGFKFKSFVASLIGVGLVYWLVFALFVFWGRIEEFTALFDFIARISITQFFEFSVVQWVFSGIIVVLLLAFVVMVNRKSSRDKVLTQILLGFLSFMVICTLVLQVLYRSNTLFWFTFALALLSFLIAYYYSLVESKWQVYSFYLLFSVFILIYCANYFSFMPAFL